MKYNDVKGHSPQLWLSSYGRKKYTAVESLRLRR